MEMLSRNRVERRNLSELKGKSFYCAGILRSLPSRIRKMAFRRQKRRTGLGMLEFLDRRPYFSPSFGDVFKHQMGDGLLEKTRNIYRKDLKGHFGCVNAIEFSNNGGHWIVSGGDDRRILLWNVGKALANKGTPAMMKGQHHSNIFCLAFDNSNEKIFSGGNDEQVIVHDVRSGETLNVFIHQDALYGLSVDPLNDNVFVSACDDGRVLIFDIRQPASEDPFVLASFNGSPMHAVVYNPMDSRLVATANARQGVALWDVRKPKSALKTYGRKQESCMSVRFNFSGDRLLALRRRLPPVLYDIRSEHPLLQFNSAGYYNSCTMKSCSFAGSKDQYILSGSDDFRLYMWRVPEDIPEDRWSRRAEFVLDGHRSIVNQVRYNADNCIIISSGVEKIIKVWSPFSISSDNGLSDASCSNRPTYTHEDYVDLLVRNGPVMTHDYSNESTEEDPRMMAFFDSLVQREMEEASSDDEDDGAMDSCSEVVVDDEVSDSDSSVTQSDYETSSPFGFVPYPLTPVHLETRNSMTRVDSSNVKENRADASSSSSSSDETFLEHSTSSGSSHSFGGSRSSSSSSDDNRDDADRRCDFSYPPSELPKVLAKTEASEGISYALNRLKRIRKAMANDSNSEPDTGLLEQKRVCINRMKSSFDSSDEATNRRPVWETDEDKSSSNNKHPAADLSSADVNRGGSMSLMEKSNNIVNDNLSSPKLSNGFTSKSMNCELQTTVDCSERVDDIGCLVYSNDCDNICNELTNVSNGGTAKSQPIETAASNLNGLNSTSEQFRQIRNRGKSSARKYRNSGRNFDESDSE